MNKPTQPEIELVGNFYRLYPDQVRSIQVEPVEPLSASWYRGWKLARGKYIAEKNNAKVIEASENLGLTFSILSGISQVCEEHSRIIVLEDDLVLHPRTLDFMIQALDRYEDDPRVSHGSGFSFPIQHAPKVDAILLPLFNTPSSKIYFQNLLPNKVN
jgi:GT2 family glycosyltransferase